MKAKIDRAKVSQKTDTRSIGIMVESFTNSRRSAIRKPVTAGVIEQVAMRITGDKTLAVFDRYHVVSTATVRRVKTAALPPSKPVQCKVTAKPAP
jgi:hypothetical protein